MAAADDAPESRPAEDPLARLGTFLGPWRMDSWLSEDDRSVCYAASSRAGDVAHMRVFSRGLEWRRNAFREAAIMRLLEGPGVPTVLSVDVTPKGEVYLVTELKPAVAVSRLLERGEPLPQPLAFGVTDALLRVVERAHAADIVLRGLTPQDVLIDTQGVVTIASWRWARALPGHALHETEATLGAADVPVDAAPEILDGWPDGPAADIYAVGRLLLSMVVGTDVAPLAREELQVRLRALVRLHQVEWVRSFVAAMAPIFEHNPASRTSSVEGMRLALAPFDRHLLAIAPVVMAAAVSSVGIVDVSSSRSQGWKSLTALQTLFEAVERVLYAIRRHGWGHESIEQGIESFSSELLSIVGDDPDGVVIDLRPYEFASRGRSIWTPAHPFDRIPYHLFAAGFRAIRVEPGVGRDECERFVRWLLVDPANDLSTEDDMATAWWQQGFVHVRADLVSSVVLSELDEYDELERELRALRIMAVDEARGRPRARLAGEERVTEPVRAVPVSARRTTYEEPLKDALSSELHDDVDWMPIRMSEVVARTWVSPPVAPHQGTVETAFLAWATEQLREDRALVVLETLHGLFEALPEHPLQAFTTALDTAEHFELCLRAVVRSTGDLRATLLSVVSRFLAEASDRVYGVVAMAASRDETADFLATVGPFLLQRVAPHTALIGDLLPTATPPGAIALMDALRGADLQGQGAALLRMRESEDQTVRMLGLEEMLVLRHPEASEYLARMMDTPRAERRQAMQTAIDANNPSAMDVLEQVGRRRDFNSWALADRHQLLMGCLTLEPERGERFVVELLAADRLIAEPAHEQTRILCAELLAELGDELSRAELQRQARRLVTSSAELQKACAKALARLEQRMQEG